MRPALLLLVAPSSVAEHWPWKISIVLARLYSMFFIGFAIGAALSALERDVAARRPFTFSSCGLGVLVVIASLRHRDRFVHGAGTWFWFGGFAFAALAFALVLLAVDARGPGASSADLAPDAPL